MPHDLDGVSAVRSAGSDRHDLARRAEDSLYRSRLRRRTVALRLEALRRRRRRRGGSATAAVLTGVLALGAPLALGHQTAKAPSSAGVLTAGTVGDGVSALQRALGARVTGTFDARTAQAVRRFQRRAGLVVDGIVGPQTRAALGLAGPAAAAQTRTAGVPSGAQATLARIAQCESGGNPAAVSADGRYRGKYQFSRATWRALGGSGDPAAAPEAEQDRLAAQLLAQRGTAPWPVCGG